MSTRIVETGHRFRYRPKPAPRALVGSHKHDAMSVCMPHLTELPTEILEKILLHLSSQDIVKMEVVRYVAATQHDSALTFRYVI